MSVIDLIPHSLRYMILSPGHEDENGDWHEGVENWSLPIPCHAVPAGAANVFTYPDGSTATYSYEVGRLDPDCREFRIGETVLLNVFGTESRYTVKGFHRKQLQSKLWL